MISKPAAIKIREYGTLFNIVNGYFNDKKKTELWFMTPNPLLGNISPFHMIRLGRFEKLKNFIEDQLNPKGDVWNG